MLARNPGVVRVATFLIAFAATFAFLWLVRVSYSPRPLSVSPFEQRLPQLEVSVDALVSSGEFMQLFVNEQWAAPLTLPVEPGRRQRYVFRGAPPDLFAIRLDPTQARGASIELHGLEVRSDDVVLAAFTGAEIASWPAANVRTGSVSGGRAVLVADSDDPMLFGRIRVAGDRRGGAVAGVKRALRQLGKVMLGASGQAMLLRLMLLLIPVVFALSQARHQVRHAAWIVLTLLTGYSLAYAAFRLSGSMGGGELPGVDLAVGQAAFRGLEKNLDFRGFGLAVLAAAAAAGGLASAWRRLRRNETPEPVDPGPPLAPSRYATPALVVAIVAFACLTFPSVVQLQDRALTPETGYDAQNLATWSYFRHLGLRPFRDFWYCYGGFHFMQLPYPPDVFYRWIHQVLVLSACAAGVLVMADRRVGRSLLVLLLGYWMVASGLLTWWDRYLLGFGALLLWAAALHRSSWRLSLLAGGYTGYVFFVEPTQVVYAAPAVLVLVLSQPRGLWRSTLRTVVPGCIVATLLASGYLAALWIDGALGEFVLFHRTMPATAIYSMHPASVADWFFRPGAEHAYLVLTLILVMIAVGSLVARASGTTSLQAALPSAIALLTVFTFQKQLTRPHMALQGMAIPAFGIALALLLRLRARWSPRASAVAWGCAGIAAAVALSGKPVLSAQARQDAKRLASLPRDVAASFDADGWQRARDDFMRPASFVIDGVGGAELAAALRARMSFEKEDDLYVLGDDAYLYILLKQQAPFYITLYNASILYSQERVVEWLRERQPKYVLWRHEAREFDGIPHAVRVPLIFAEVISSYVPAGAHGNFTILQRRASDLPVAIDFWRDRLGGVHDLGYIPARAVPLEERPASPGAVRYDVLSVNVDQPVGGRSRALTFDHGAHGRFSLRFLERAGTRRYTVVLDRVWFWSIARAAGISPVLEGPSEDGVSAHVASLDAARAVLY